MGSERSRPIIAITMGDPVGVGPELVCRVLADPAVYKRCRPLIIGDLAVLAAAKKVAGVSGELREVDRPSGGRYEAGGLDVYPVSRLSADTFRWGHPTAVTGQAMLDYITTGIDLALSGDIGALVTSPINKTALKLAGSRFHGHTELLAHRCGSSRYAMMMAGTRLRVVLATIHVPLRSVPDLLNTDLVFETIRITGQALRERFGLNVPRIAVAGLNPHAGEGEMFGDEEARVIEPAVSRAVRSGIDASGPFPPDTLFYHALAGPDGHAPYDAVVCMYHDQGLIPFKLIHFSDGVNTTLGLPIIRTSVDHGTAYDIAGKGVADPGSLIAAIFMAAEQAVNRQAGHTETAE
ncbi:MAG: 4-hydroxythreonine-4-phosphate dehydrogenase PdxA [Thermodesulfobacteriota bacterium]